MDSYIRTPGINCAVINMVLNPVVAWLGNRPLNFTPLAGDNSLVVDTAVTCIVLSLLVALFTASGVRQALHNGRVQVTDGSPRAGRLLSHLPRKAWALGLLLGLGVVCVFTPLSFGVFYSLGFSGLPFAWFALFKAIYTAPLGFIDTRWVILRPVIGLNVRTPQGRRVESQQCLYGQPLPRHDDTGFQARRPEDQRLLALCAN